MDGCEFDITIGKDGVVELHVKGFHGSACLDVIKMFERMAGEMKSAEQTGDSSRPQESLLRCRLKNIGSFGQTLL